MSKSEQMKSREDKRRGGHYCARPALSQRCNMGSVLHTYTYMIALTTVSDKPCMPAAALSVTFRWPRSKSAETNHVPNPPRVLCL